MWSILIVVLGCAGEGYDVYVPEARDDYSYAGMGLARVDDDACAVSASGDLFTSASGVFVENRTDGDLELVRVDTACVETPLEPAPARGDVQLNLTGGDVLQVRDLDGGVRSTWMVTPAGLSGGITTLVLQ
jgi:hypothetical protein